LLSCTVDQQAKDGAAADGVVLFGDLQVLERGERLELLVVKTDQLQSEAFSFKRESRRLQQRLWWRNVRLWAIIGAVTLMSLYVIIAVTCSPTFHC
jgi:Synaptobrevin